MTNLPFSNWNDESASPVVETGESSFETRKQNELVLSRFYSLKAQASLAVERRDEEKLATIVSLIWGFLVGVKLDDPQVAQGALNFIRSEKHSLHSLIRELNQLEDSFMSFRKK